jgi:hypothetical protein
MERTVSSRWCRALAYVRRAPLMLIALLLILLTGCVFALRPYNTPSQQKVCLQTPIPTSYTVQVADADTVSVPADGRVTFEVPRLQRGCDAYLFGLVKVRDGSPEKLSTIHVRKGGKTVRKLSLAKLSELPVDAAGYHVLVLK